MKTANRPFLMIILFVLFLGSTLGTTASAHDLAALNGQKSAHKHVYKRNSFGKGVTAGHYARPAGSNGIVIWSASPEPNYGKSLPGITIPRNHRTQPSQKQVFGQAPSLTQDQKQTSEEDKQ